MKRILYKKETKELEVPNRETKEALKDTKLFKAKDATEMIRDALGDPNWQPRSEFPEAVQP
jgi:hypothetical protein